LKKEKIVVLEIVKWVVLIRRFLNFTHIKHMHFLVPFDAAGFGGHFGGSFIGRGWILDELRFVLSQFLNFEKRENCSFGNRKVGGVDQAFSQFHTYQAHAFFLASFDASAFGGHFGGGFIVGGKVLDELRLFCDNFGILKKKRKLYFWKS
jgi:hypothetical protein